MRFSFKAAVSKVIKEAIQSVSTVPCVRNLQNTIDYCNGCVQLIINKKDYMEPHMVH